MVNLKDLLKHEVQDLYSAEEQIIEALPAMISKAKNKSLKKALQEHLAVTKKQKDRLDEVRQLLNDEEAEGKSNEGFFAKMFGGGSHKCKGMEGVITEGEKVMAEDMSPAVMDAAIIACAQKVEHYEICGYGTARAYARELNLGEVAELLEETLNEEYEADDLLTDLAVGRLNEEAETGSSSNGRSNGRSSSGRNSSGRSKSASSSSSSRTGGTRSASRSRSTRTSSTRSSSSRSKTARSNGTAKKTASSKRGRAKAK